MSIIATEMVDNKVVSAHIGRGWKEAVKKSENDE